MKDGHLVVFMGQSMVAITQQDCTGCDLCIAHCPFEALLPLAINPQGRKHSKRPVIVVENNCVGCLSCIGSCPTDALYEIAIPESAIKSLLMNPTKQEDTEKVNRWKKGGLGVA